MKDKAIINIQEYLDILRERALAKLTVYLAISALFLFVAFLYRLTDIDWQGIYILQYFCFCIFVLVFFFRKKLSYKTTIHCHLALGLIVSVTEFMSLGLSGMGGIASLFCIMLSLFYLNRRSTAIVALIVVVIFGIAQYQFLYAGRLVSENDLVYMSWHSAWFGRFVVYMAFFLIIGGSIYYLQDQIIRLLIEIESQKRTIEQQNKHINYLANHDALTGLSSLRVAERQLEETLRVAELKRHEFALLFLDLDGFKVINDTHGHEAGDVLLKQVAERILLAIRSSDTACRVGGDEFIVIVEKISNRQDIESLCQRLIKSITAPVTYRNAELRVGVSIGAASYPESAKTSRDLRHKADELMYQVKKSGKNNYLISMKEAALV